VKEIFIAWFGAIVLVFFALRGAIDLLASIDYAQETFPLLKRLVQTKKWHNLLLSATCLFYAATLYELLTQPAPPPIVNPDPAVKAITPIIQENVNLRNRLAVLTEPEPKNSLRRKTIRLAADIEEFWNEIPPSPGGPPSNPVTDEDKKRTDTWAKYWREAKMKYDSHSFNDKVLEIVREYQLKSVPTGYLEAIAQDRTRMIGGPQPFAGPSGLVLCNSDICTLRELAFHVNAQDEVIHPAF
jgi:hypothetical protein